MIRLIKRLLRRNDARAAGYAAYLAARKANDTRGQAKAAKANRAIVNETLKRGRGC